MRTGANQLSAQSPVCGRLVYAPAAPAQHAAARDARAVGPLLLSATQSDFGCAARACAPSLGPSAAPVPGTWRPSARSAHRADLCRGRVALLGPVITGVGASLLRAYSFSVRCQTPARCPHALLPNVLTIGLLTSDTHVRRTVALAAAALAARAARSRAIAAIAANGIRASATGRRRAGVAHGVAARRARRAAARRQRGRPAPLRRASRAARTARCGAQHDAICICAPPNRPMYSVWFMMVRLFYICVSFGCACTCNRCESTVLRARTRFFRCAKRSRLAFYSYRLVYKKCGTLLLALSLFHTRIACVFV